jgi:putative peptide zinc metalloprotease protein
MHPRLRPHVQITRQHYRGRRWHVVHDPSSNQYFRLSPVGHEFIGLLDGRRSVEEIWQIGLQRHGDEALTQNEVIQLLSQLYSGNLLSTDATPETEQLLRRGRERVTKKAQQQAIGIMYFRVRLFNPDFILTWLEPIFRPLLGRVGFIMWAVLLVVAVANILPHWNRLVTGFDSAIAPSNWGWMLVVFVVLKLWHEIGHGVICKRLGGQVPEFGAMMLVLVPAPYVDASAAWAFASKWQRIAVGAGGMIFELALASVCAFIWLNTPDTGSLLHQLSYNAMLSASVSTVLFNANPLMRFDGYYMLSDLLEVPNLSQRSNQMLKFLLQRHVYRVKNALPPTASLSEAVVLLTYGVLALAYRVFIFFTITLYLVGKLFAIGVILAVWTAGMWFMLPVGQFVHWLATHQSLSEFRARAVLTSVLLIASGILLLGAVPMPDHRRASGVMESLSRSGVFFQADGFVAQVHKVPGERVVAGDPIVTCVSDRLSAQVRLLRAELEEAQARERWARTRNVAAGQVAAQYVATLQEQLAYLEEQETRLVVRAPQDGVIVGGDLNQMIGRFVRHGEPLCAVVEPRSMRATATLAQQEAWIYGLSPDNYTVEIRRASRVADVIPARFERSIEVGDRLLPHPALGYSGGGTLEVEQRDQSGMLAKSPIFKAYFTAIPEEEGGAPDELFTAGGLPANPGERLYFRFRLPSKPLAVQWLDRLQKILQGRARI